MYFSRDAGTIYAFLFSADIIPSLLIAAFNAPLQMMLGYLGLFLIVSIWGIVALIATLLYPQNPSPLGGPNSGSAYVEANRPLKAGYKLPTSLTNLLMTIQKLRTKLPWEPRLVILDMQLPKTLHRYDETN